MSDPFHHFLHRSNNQWIKIKKQKKNKEYSQKEEHKTQQTLQIFNQKNHPIKTTQQAKLKSQKMR